MTKPDETEGGMPPEKESTVPDEADGGTVPEEDLSDELLEGQRWTTVGDLGHRLPCAVGPDVSYTFRTANLGLKLERGRKVPETLKARPMLYLAHFLAVSLESVQGRRLTDMGVEEAALLMRSLPSSSVLQMLVRYWIDRRGSDVLVRDDIICPQVSCGAVQDVPLHLSQMRVRAWDHLDALPRIECELVDDFRFPGDRTVSAVAMEPAPWDACCELGDGQLASEGEQEVANLQRAIVSTDTVEGRVTIPRPVLERLSADDAVGLGLDLDLLSGGPEMAMGAECARCKSTFYVGVPFSSLDFFGQEVRRMRRRRRRLVSS